MSYIRLQSEISELFYMITSATILRDKFKINNNNKNVNDAVDVLLEAEKHRIQEAFTTLQNNLSAAFLKEFNSINQN